MYVKKSDCCVRTHFPEYTQAGIPLAGIPILFGTNGNNLWPRPGYTHWNETDLQTWTTLNPHLSTVKCVTANEAKTYANAPAEGACLGGQQLRACVLSTSKSFLPPGGGEVASGWQAWSSCKVGMLGMSKHVGCSHRPSTCLKGSLTPLAGHLVQLQLH